MANLSVSILFNASTQAAQRSLTALRASVGGLSASFVGLKGVAVAALATLGVGKLFGDAVGAAKDFETQLSTIRGLLELTGESGQQLAGSMGAIEAESKRLGRTTQFSASQAAAGFEVLLRAGLDTEKAIAAIPVVLDTAAASGIGLDEAASRLLSTTSNLQLGVEGMQRASDVLNVAAAKADTNFQQLNDAVAVAGSNARLYGFELEQLTGALGILANSAFKGTEAGTGLRNMFGELRNEASPVAKALREANVNAADLNEVFTFLSSGTDSARATMFKFTEEARRAVQILLDAGGTGGIERFADQLRNVEGATASLAQRMTDNLEGSLKSLGSAWEGLQLNFVNQDFLTEIRGLVDGITAKIGEFANSQELVLFREAVITLFRDTRQGLDDFLSKFSFTKAKEAAGDFAESFEQNLTRVKAAAGSISSIVQASAAGIETAYQTLIFTGNVVVKKFFELRKASADIGIETLTQRIREFEEAGREAPADLIRDLNRLKASSSAAGDTISDLDADAERAFTAMNDAAGRTARAFEQLNEDVQVATGQTKAAVEELPAAAESATDRLSRALAPAREEVVKAKEALDTLLNDPDASGEQIAAAINRVGEATRNYDKDLENLTIRYSQYQDKAIPALEASAKAASDTADSTDQAKESTEALTAAMEERLTQRKEEIDRLNEISDAMATERQNRAISAQVAREQAKEQGAAIVAMAEAQKEAARTSQEVNAMAEQGQRRASEAAGAFRGVISGAIEGISALGERAFAFYTEARGGAAAAADETNRFTETARNLAAVMEENRRTFSRLDAYSAWARDVNETFRRWNEEMGRATIMLDQIREGMERGTLSTYQLDEATRQVETSLRTLDDRQLAPLRQAIEQARREFEALSDSIESRTRSLQDRLDRLRGDEEAILAREIDAQREQIEADRERAGNNRELLRELDRQLAALRQIENLERQRLRRDREATAGQPTEDIPRQTRGGGGTTTATQTTGAGGAVASSETLRERETVLPILIPADRLRQAVFSGDLEAEVRRQQTRRLELVR